MWPYLQWNASEDHAIYHVGNKVLLSIRYHLDSLSRRTRPDEGHPGDRHFHLQRRHSRRFLFHCFAIAFSEPPGSTCHVLLSSQLLIFTPPRAGKCGKIALFSWEKMDDASRWTLKKTYGVLVYTLAQFIWSRQGDYCAIHLSSDVDAV